MCNTSLSVGIIGIYTVRHSASSTSAGAVFDEFIRLKNAPSYSLKDSTKNGKNRSSDYGECEIAVPRDRNGDFEPKVIEKRQTFLS